MLKKLALAVALASTITAANASNDYTIVPGHNVIGEEQTYNISADGTTTLEYVAAEYSLGLSNMIEANPNVDPIVPKKGTTLIIPTKLLLPPTVHEGVIINSAEMRLYYFHGNKVTVFPIGIGQLGKGTPINWVTKIERKRANPTWTPTANTRAEYAAAGEPLPAVVPAGPDNPMGLFAAYVGRLYAIHGTNADFGIGLRVSHGCVRLRNEDNEHFFNMVPVGTRVEFISQPIKFAEEPNGDLYIEVHQPLSRSQSEFENFDTDVPFTFTQAQLEFFKDPRINQDILQRALEERSGRPVLLNPAEF
ncbi:MAG: L,D-transpeptidase family protein [Succinatimonas sp.]|jgi:L,D-transpeptidase YbiS|nr:L,D-transpeptidase family protein [Succinatimonas sp.]MDD5869121.1 L,D-transpeptidase family protein [Succinatimonas sp.]MDY5722547.1 L,D-transpeptidase family protein [Succinivibrio sp.]